jgi:hypothetical protein
MRGECRGRPVALLPLLHGCPPVVARLNAADAAWAVAGWVGQRLHKSKCPSLQFVRTARPFESCANKSLTHKNLVRNVRYESGFGGLRPPVRNAENTNSTYRHGIGLAKKQIRVQHAYWQAQHIGCVMRIVQHCMPGTHALKSQVVVLGRAHTKSRIEQ